jgi:hypothetical protein
MLMSDTRIREHIRVLERTEAAQRVVLHRMGIEPAVLGNPGPVPMVQRLNELEEPVPEEEEAEGYNSVEMEEEAPTGISGSDNEHNDTETVTGVTPSEAAAETQTPRPLQRLQFGSMTLAEAENYST